MKKIDGFELARRVKIATRSPDVVDLCDWVMAGAGVTHVTSQASVSTQDVTSHDGSSVVRAITSAECPVCAARKAAHAAKMKKTRQKGKKS